LPDFVHIARRWVFADDFSGDDGLLIFANAPVDPIGALRF
jgi:hypothetical protein